MLITDFEKELKEFDPDLSIRPNNPPQRVIEMFPDSLKLASILYQGEELCTIPNHEIYDEKNPSYGVDLRNDGRFMAHRTRLEALDIVKTKVNQLKGNTEYADQFFGRGEYSDAALRSNNEPVQQVVEDVEVKVVEVTEQAQLENPEVKQLTDTNV